MHGEHVAFRLLRAPQLGRTHVEDAGDEDGIELRIDEQFFQIADEAARRDAVTLQLLEAGGGTGIEAYLVATGRRQGAGHLQTIGMIAHEPESHELKGNDP